LDYAGEDEHGSMLVDTTPNYGGLYQFLNQPFCEQTWAGCEYINRMEDLGIESLRKAKMALYPHHMAKKYNITLKE
jgi:hypothetical protein